MIRLNTVAPADGAKKERRRVGRGIGSGLGKTAGRGHKGQKSRAGGFHKVGFEGGQMPIQRRLPKRGFKSLSKGDVISVRTSTLDKMTTDLIDLQVLKLAGVVPQQAKGVKVYLAGAMTRKIIIRGITLSRGARAEIERMGGQFLDANI